MPRTRVSRSSGTVRWNRVKTDIFDAVGRADDRKHEDRRREIGPWSHEHDRETPEHQSEAEDHGQSSPSKRDRPDSSDQSAYADRGRQVTDVGCVPVEHAEDGHHDQDIQAAADEGLRNGEPDQ